VSVPARDTSALGLVGSGNGTRQKLVSWARLFFFLSSVHYLFCFVSEGFTTMAANEGLEKARAGSPRTDGFTSPLKEAVWA